MIYINMMKLTKSGFLISENIIKSSKRTLLNGFTLGIANFESRRQIWKPEKNTSQFMYHINNSSMNYLLNSTIFWTHMVTNLDGELDLLKLSLRRIYENLSEIQNEEDVSRLYNLGPTTMRMFHYLNLPLEALKFYYDFNSNSSFATNTTLMILMDNLFIHGKYQEILDVYRTHTGIAQQYTFEQQQESFINRTLVIAACYKLNTPESFQITLDLLNDSNDKFEVKINRSKHFAAMLAINQKEPKLALSILSENENGTNSMNIKLLALAALNDWHGVADLLCLIERKHWQETNGNMYRVSTGVIQNLKDSISEKNLPQKEYDECNRVLMVFQDTRDLMVKASMDELLCWPIDFRPTESRRENFT